MAPVPPSNLVMLEVFKRDSFKCHYCGAAAPAAFLQIDHIEPVAKGGTHEIRNLVTSCCDCNSGKGPPTLSDTPVVESHRSQLDELKQRRLQLDMMIEWREGLVEKKETEADLVIHEINRRCKEHWGQEVEPWEIKEANSWVRKFGARHVLDAIPAALHQLEGKGDSFYRSDLLDLIGRIAYDKSEEKPQMRELYYVRGILRMRLENDVDESYCMKLLEHAVGAGIETRILKSCAQSATTWQEFRVAIENYISDCNRQEF